jgi:hypothetical protein
MPGYRSESAGTVCASHTHYIGCPQGFEPRYADPESASQRFLPLSDLPLIIPYCLVFSRASTSESAAKRTSY